MRARSALLVLAALAACAGPANSTTGRAPESQAENARPQSDPALMGAPTGPAELLPIEEVAVRVRRVAEGRFTIVEFLPPGLTESEQVKLRLAFEAGELRVAGQGAAGEESWITTLLRSR